MPKVLIPNLNFYVDRVNVNKKGLLPIKASVTIAGKKTNKTVGHVLFSDWNRNQQRVRAPRPGKNNNHLTINKSLDELQSRFKEYALKCLDDQKPVTADMAKEFLNNPGKFVQHQKISFWDAFNEYFKFGLLTKSENTNRNIKTNFNKIRSFQETTGFKVTWQSVNLIFFDRLKKYILEDLEHGYNYISTITTRLKAFMNWSYKRKYHNNLEFKKFSAPEKEISVIYLTWDELKQFNKYEFENKTLQKARDFFVFGCLTGQRYSDLIKLTRDNIVDGEIILSQEKTNEPVKIPIYKELETIINRYNHYKLLPKFSNQKLNKYIKEACRIAGIDTITENKIFIKNETVKEYKPKYELIGTHTARKTFICLAYERGMDIEMIKSITGIKMEKTLKRYLQISTDTKKEKLKAAFGGL